MASLARPGGNVTGWRRAVEADPQGGFQLLKEAAPRLPRVVAYLQDPLSDCSAPRVARARRQAMAADARQARARCAVDRRENLTDDFERWH